MQLKIHTSIEEIPEADWCGWFGDDYPFLRWDFLRGLERSDCTTGSSGWQPCHLTLTDGDSTIAVVPSFLKDHSYGEYVFDWAWADAWERSGLRYYPKLVTAMPFTPASGPRLWLNPEIPDALAMCVQAVGTFCRDKGISGWHLLFVTEEDDRALANEGLHPRSTVQFHWFNRNFSDFDDFLATFSSRKRKNLKKERSRVLEQGLSLQTLSGADISTDDWAFFHRCYQTTYAKRSGHGGYLTKAFFTEVCPQLGDAVVMVIAREGEDRVAAALYFRDTNTLYGRYWGCLREYDYLHFEACYYRGIEYCIENGLSRFDPGAQGEHKIQRGFEPVLTHSRHWLAEPGFEQAIAAFCSRELEHVRAYQAEARTLLPFKSQSAD